MELPNFKPESRTADYKSALLAIRRNNCFFLFISFSCDSHTQSEQTELVTIFIVVMRFRKSEIRLYEPPGIPPVRLPQTEHMCLTCWPLSSDLLTYLGATLFPQV